MLTDRLQALDFRIRTNGTVKYIMPPVSNVPAGEFLMGSDPARDRQAVDNEEPQQRVTVNAFQIAKHPVTVAEYAAFVMQTGYSVPGDWLTQQLTPDHPVVEVPWADVKAYAAWLVQLTGYPWRLPTEAEWEKAARGSDGRFYPWGDTWDRTRAHSNDGGPGNTTQVGTYPAGISPYDVWDMAGNVWEWTSSLYRPYPYRQNDGRENPDLDKHRVLRGGSWADNAQAARAAYRNDLVPGDILGHHGYRLIIASPGSG
jgi:formylglycine-generating enzyme required for sulfatase activity